MDKVGKWAFVVGLVLAIVAGVMELSWSAAALAVLGIVVGILNVSAEESTGFLLAAIGLMLSATSLDVIPWVGDALSPIVANVAALIAPAILVVAIKTLLTTAKD